MARLGVMTWAAVGIMATLITLPTTRWILAEDLEFATGGWGHVNEFPTPIPVRIYDPGLWPSQTETQQLVKATFNTNRLTDGRRETPYCASLKTFTQVHPGNIQGWAHLLRYLCTLPSRPMSPTEPPEALDRIKWMIRAAKSGERLDPENGYFPAMLAAVNARVGKWDEARDALLRAGSRAHYNDYSVDESRLGLATIEMRWGFRGQTTDAILLSSTLLPHLSWLRNNLTAIVYRHPEPDESARHATVLFASRMSSDAYGPVTHYVARFIAARAIDKDYDANQPDDRKVERTAKALDSRSSDPYLTASWREIPEPNKEFQANFESQLATFNANLPKTPYGPSIALLAAAFVWPLLTITGGLAKWKSARRGEETVSKWRVHLAIACGIVALAMLVFGIIHFKPVNPDLSPLAFLAFFSPVPVLLVPRARVNFDPWVKGIVIASALTVLASVPDRLQRDSVIGSMARELSEPVIAKK